MPRKLKSSTQKTLHDFLPVPSSPIQPSSSSIRPTRSRPGVTRQRSKARKSRKHNNISSDEESVKAQSPDSGSDVGAIAFESAVMEISDSEDEAESSPRKSATARRVHRKRAMSDDEITSSGSRDPSEEYVGIPVTWKGKGKASQRKRKVVEDSDSQEGIQPRRRKLIKGERPLTPETENLMEELDEDKILDVRLRIRDKKSTYLQNLEKIKRKKRGEKVSDDEEDEEVSDHVPSSIKPFKHSRPGFTIHNDASELEEDTDDTAEEEEDTFIVEDGNAAPLELPAEFSMSTYQDLTHHFKVICQLFVHLAVQEKEDRAVFMEEMYKEQYFSVPLQIARRKIDGTRDSVVASSVWRTEYKKSLQIYPIFEVTHLQFSVPTCDACHLGGRISTLVGRLSGEPYDRQTFEPISESDDSEDGTGSSDNENERTRRRKKEYHLGRFCARRTRVFHEFMHWEHTLFHALAREVDDLRRRISDKKPGERVYVPVAYAGGMKPPENIQDADEVMMWLDSRHIIAREVQRLKQMMESATNLEVASKRGEDDE